MIEEDAELSIGKCVVDRDLADIYVRMETVWVPVWDSDSISARITVIKP